MISVELLFVFSGALQCKAVFNDVHGLPNFNSFNWPFEGDHLEALHF